MPSVLQPRLAQQKTGVPHARGLTTPRLDAPTGTRSDHGQWRLVNSQQVEPRLQCQQEVHASSTIATMATASLDRSADFHMSAAPVVDHTQPLGAISQRILGQIKELTTRASCHVIDHELNIFRQ